MKDHQHIERRRTSGGEMENSNTAYDDSDDIHSYGLMYIKKKKKQVVWLHERGLVTGGGILEVM
jgi:hypothetical protein